MWHWIWSLLLFMNAHASSSATTTFIVTRNGAETTNTGLLAAGVPYGTTEGPLQEMKMLSMDVRSDISLRYAHTKVVTNIRNSDWRPQEATYKLILPNSAYITGFSMILNGETFKARVEKREDAQIEYTKALAGDQGAALISVLNKLNVRNSNLFTVNVNVQGKTEAMFILTYEELLQRSNGVYKHAINLYPPNLLPRLNVVVYIKEISNLLKVDMSEKDFVKKTSDGGEKEVIIEFSPNEEQQKILNKRFLKKNIQTRYTKLHSYKIYDGTDDGASEPLKGALDQFVVQYDVERSPFGELVVNDGYFVHFFAPANLKPLNKHIIFILDTSASMKGDKILKLKHAMKYILEDLNEKDYFSVIEFSSGVYVHDLKGSHVKTPKNFLRTQETLVPPALTTIKNKELAVSKIINRLKAGGGTNIHDALKKSIELANKGVGWTENDQNNKGTEISDKSSPIPCLFFLTDGKSDVKQSSEETLRLVGEENKKEAAIFSLAFGNDADEDFLRRLSLLNHGFMRHIYDAADAAEQLQNFYSEISTPLSKNVKFEYADKQVLPETVTQQAFPTLFNGSELVVAGKLANLKDLTLLHPQVYGSFGNENNYTLESQVHNQQLYGNYSSVERLWAYLTIQQKLDKMFLAETDSVSNGTNASVLKDEATQLALKYSFVTLVTSLVVVKPKELTTVNPESVDKLEATPDVPKTPVKTLRMENQPKEANKIEGEAEKPRTTWKEVRKALRAVSKIMRNRSDRITNQIRKFSTDAALFVKHMFIKE